MKKLGVLFLLFGLCLPLVAKEKRHNFEIGYEMSDYTYREPHMEYPISNKADKQGISVVYTRQSVLSDDINEDDPTFASIEFRYMNGKTDYDGYMIGYDSLLNPVVTPFKSHDKDYYTELGLKLGRSYKLFSATKLWPYFGIAGRWLRNGEDKYSDLGGGQMGFSYQRTSTYIYVPLGANLTFDMGDTARLTLNGQFDWLIHGNQNSHVSDEWNVNSVSNEQNKGLGLRASAKLSVDMGKIGVFVEPFYRYWKIQNSKDVNYIFHYTDEHGDPQEAMGSMREPYNTTREYGIRMGIAF